MQALLAPRAIPLVLLVAPLLSLQHGTTVRRCIAQRRPLVRQTYQGCSRPLLDGHLRSPLQLCGGRRADRAAPIAATRPQLHIARRVWLLLLLSGLRLVSDATTWLWPLLLLDMIPTSAATLTRRRRHWR